jgi:hypothetical protein
MATLFQWLRNPVFLRPPLVAVVIGKQLPGGYFTGDLRRWMLRDNDAAHQFST